MTALLLVAVTLVVTGCNDGDDGAPIDPSDTTPPTAVSDLAAIALTQTSATLGWTAPGDDGMLGMAERYDLRFSTDSLAVWDAMTRPAAPSPPRAAGTAETTTVALLTAGTAYTFELRTVDEAGNWSGPSNRLRASTASPPDLVAPARVNDLAVAYPSGTTITVSWSIVGDDGFSGGPAAAYDLRYATSAATPWEAMTEVSGEPTPLAAGSSQSMTVSGLTFSTTYYFQLRVADEVPNWSDLSNVATGTTLARGEVCGPILRDTRWTLAESPYRLTCNVGVGNGATLTIAPGVEIEIPGALSINETATLIADGTAVAPIRFFGAGQMTFRGLRGDWANDSTYAAGSLMRHCTVELPIDCTTAPVFINCTIRGNASPYSVVTITEDNIPEVRFLRCLFENHLGYGSPILLGAQRSLFLIGCTFRNNRTYDALGGSALTLTQGGWCRIRNSTFTGNSSQYGTNILIRSVQFFEMTCSELSGPDCALLLTQSSGSSTYPIRIEDCNLAGLGDCFVYNRSQNTITLPNNWWGTTDSLEVFSRIFDCRDGDGNRGCALVQPLRTGPVNIAECGE